MVLTFLRNQFPNKADSPKSSTITPLPEDAIHTGDHISPTVEIANRKLAASILATTLAVGGTVVGAPLVVLASVPLNLYASSELFKAAYRKLVKEKRTSANLVDSVYTFATIAGGFNVQLSAERMAFNVGDRLLYEAESRTYEQLANLYEGQHMLVHKVTDDGVVQIPIEQVQAGDTLRIGMGEFIAVDGKVIRGTASVDQRMLTGESQPVEKTVDQEVMSATIVLAGEIDIEVIRSGGDTIAAQISKTLENTTSYESRIQTDMLRMFDRISLPLIVAGVVSFPIFGISGLVVALGSNFTEVIRNAAPLTMMSYLSLASQMQVLVKDARSFELLNEVNTIVFDKTGTLTLEEPSVWRVYTASGFTEHEILRFAGATELNQTHPIARAIVQAAEQQQIEFPSIEYGDYELGYGIVARIENHLVKVGSRRFMEQGGIEINAEFERIEAECYARGQTIIYVALNDRLAGAIELSAVLRPEAIETINALKERGIEVHIMSGDHEEPTRQLAQQLGVEKYHAQVLPQEKASEVEKLQAQGKVVAFVGDGINDAIALKTAHVSFSMRGATALATDTAQVVLLDQDLRHILSMLDMAKEFKKRMRNNVLLSVVPSIISAGGLFVAPALAVSIQNIFFTSSFAAGVMNSTFPVIKNAWDKQFNKVASEQLTQPEQIVVLPKPEEVEAVLPVETIQQPEQ
ncbi:MAG: heavy metal translocating P-type ATPase [Phototrophicaceae bacterium]